ncbi:hypothetical protein MAR_022338 [Mya arenaria]|uniref:Uncharacterized protein n=1 Tax=Mya arenaria TaxID=6604 RepID=A0ABY7DMP8_MYAAR|nr:hypothetical protein MAR_022338 [Mya arenaria]
MYLNLEKPIIVRYGHPKTPVKIPYEIEAKDAFEFSPRLQTPDDDHVFSVLCKLQDGLKVKPHEASDALRQYRRFQAEIGRLQSTIHRPSRYPKMTSSLYMQEKNFKDRTRKIIEAKERENVQLKQKVAELSLRLSAMLGMQVVEPTDKKSDLTDTFKPVQLAEDFRDIFDNEWEHAFEELKVTMEEAKVLVYLGKVTWVAFEFAKDIAEQQLDELMKKEIEILRIMSKPSFEEKERRKPIVSDDFYDSDDAISTIEGSYDYRRGKKIFAQNCGARLPHVHSVIIGMPLHPPVKSPNIEKLFNYLQKSQWHNVSASFSGFVRKEFEEDLTKLEEDEGMYRDLKLMIEYAEMGRFSEARNLMDPAFKEYQAILHNLDELHLTKSARHRAQYTDRSHMEQAPPTNRQEVYSPEKRPPPTPKQMPNPGYMSPQRQPMSPSRQHQDLPQEREKIESPSPQYRQEQQNPYDIHRENYDGLRLKSPEKQPYSQSSRLPTPNDRPVRPSSHKSDKGSEPGHYNSNNQMASSKALWGREHGDKPSEKIGSSTYRQEFQKIPMENNERVDRDKYRENFGSLAERDIYRSDADDRIGSSESARRPGHQKRHPETPDYDQRPSELARKFKLLFDNEWKDAYDEVCGFYAKSSQSAREKTARHLLWIVTETAIIANDVAERQLKDLEKHALDVMTTPGYNDEAWLINDDVAEKQLKDIEKATLGLMTTPGPEHVKQN